MSSATRISSTLSSFSIIVPEAPGSSKTSHQALGHTCALLKCECEGLKRYLALKETLRKPRSHRYLFGYGQHTWLLLPGDHPCSTTRRQCWRWFCLFPLILPTAGQHLSPRLIAEREEGLGRVQFCSAFNCWDLSILENCSWGGFFVFDVRISNTLKYYSYRHLPSPGHGNFSFHDCYWSLNTQSSL